MNENLSTNNSIQQGATGARRKSSLVTGTIVLGVIAIAAIAYSVYAWQQNRQLSSDIATKNNQIAELQKQKTTPATTPTTSVDPYAGWQSATLKYEKASFKYPSGWKLTNVSTPHSSQDAVTPGYDKAKLVSPTGLTLTIDTGVSGIGDGPYYGTVLSTTSIATLGGSYFLGFGTNGADSNSTTVNGGTVGTAATKANFLTSKNITSVAGQAYDVISMAYFDASGSAITKPVSAFQGDTSYNDALMIIKSLSY